MAHLTMHIILCSIYMHSFIQGIYSLFNYYSLAKSISTYFLLKFSNYFYKVIGSSNYMYIFIKEYFCLSKAYNLCICLINAYLYNAIIL